MYAVRICGCLLEEIAKKYSEAASGERDQGWTEKWFLAIAKVASQDYLT